MFLKGSYLVVFLKVIFLEVVQEQDSSWGWAQSFFKCKHQNFAPSHIIGKGTFHHRQYNRVLRSQQQWFLPLADVEHMVIKTFWCMGIINSKGKKANLQRQSYKTVALNITLVGILLSSSSLCFTLNKRHPFQSNI